MAGDKHPEWLPVDWKVEEKKKSGKKRKWYIAPNNGLKFFSKPEVIRYLNEDASTLQQLVEQDKVTTERTVAKKLPAGWIKEFRRRRISGKKDPVYIEPVTENEFRSMRSVLRYLEAKEGDENHMGKTVHSQSSPAKAKGKLLIENKGDEELDEGKNAEPERSPANSGAENPIQLNEQQDISVDDYLIEPRTDFAVPKEQIQRDRSAETPAVGSSSKLPPDDFFNVSWFAPAYKLIVDEIPVETYVQQTLTGLGVPQQG